MHLRRAQHVQATGPYGKPLKVISCLSRAVIIPATKHLQARQHTRKAVLMNPSSPASSRNLGVLCRGSASSTVLDVQPNNSSATLLRVHYLRKDASYKGWGLHVWGDAPSSSTDWAHALEPTGVDEHGMFWDVPLKGRADCQLVGLLVHQGESKAARAELTLAGRPLGDIWLAGDEQQYHDARPDLSLHPAGSMNKQAAHWVGPRTLLWRQPVSDAAGPRTFQMHISKDARLHIAGAGVEGADRVINLDVIPGAIPKDAMSRYPFLYGCTVLQIPAEFCNESEIQSLLKGQHLLSVASASGAAVDASGVQLQGVLDSVAAYEGPLGEWNDGPKRYVSVWAPTAQSVQLVHYSSARGGAEDVHSMTEGEKGVWTLEVPGTWAWNFYTYRTKVYCPFTQKIEITNSTDPYSRSLAANGERSQFVDLTDSLLQPPGWSTDVSPPLEAFTDISVYELHVRDFSITDASVAPAARGKYVAFSAAHAAGEGAATAKAGTPVKLSAGLAHLASLRSAGMTHIHLLPVYDFGSVPERYEEQGRVKEDLRVHAADSERQQQAVAAIADHDGFNWGYDPVHYGVPEGSYATNPDGPARISEFRTMVASLHTMGLRVVLDVVYNHTFAAGPHNRNSVLDKVVPGYYHRRMEDGEVCHSTCCNNTASENFMCERLVVEDIVHWARTYKIDGFRFDIMGHLMLSTMNKIRSSLDALDLKSDGVDGSKIYVYGEAWDFGEVMCNQRGRNASQMNLAGSGLGGFNDRLRDGALGGGPFAPHDFQGLVTGLSLQPNTNKDQGDAAAQAELLLVLSDWVRYSMAGNLRSFSTQTADGTILSGGDARAHGLPLAYGALPCENVAFIGCHDNMTIFDIITEKAATDVSIEDRSRMAGLCLSLIALSQGIAFFHAGDDMLRSKSLDRDSYNSGDWFNRMDWSGADNNFGVGLPPASKNAGQWNYKRIMLANPNYKPSPALIASTAELFKVLLRVRYSSPLFRLPTAEHISKQLKFHNTGPAQVPGVIIMQLTSAEITDASADATFDPLYKTIVVAVNCSPSAHTFPVPAGVALLKLHPAMVDSGDLRLTACGVAEGELTVAARCAAVFVQPRE